jgi:CRISPR-associated protein Cas1
MSTLYIDQQFIRLQQDGNALAIYQNDKRQGTLPTSLLQRIVIRGRVQLDTAVIGWLSDQQISLMLMTGRHGRRLTHIPAGSHGDAWRRIRQYALYRNDPWRQQWSHRLMRHKLLAQRKLLTRELLRRPDQRYAVSKGIGQIKKALERLHESRPDIASLRGIEGASAAAYFNALAAVFPDSAGFDGRNRRPPKDPVNACLSLGYTLLHYEAVQSCFAKGLDPLIGFFHDLDHGRESLASDLIEPLRPYIDGMVLRLFVSQALQPSQFSREGEACLLNKEGRKVFYEHYEQQARPLRRLLRRALDRLLPVMKEACQGDGEAAASTP